MTFQSHPPIMPGSRDEQPPSISSVNPMWKLASVLFRHFIFYVLVVATLTLLIMGMVSIGVGKTSEGLGKFILTLMAGFLAWLAFRQEVRPKGPRHW